MTATHKPMYTLSDKIFINAPVQTVWECALQPDNFRRWSSAFAEGSHYVGSWRQGETLRFLADASGKMGGMLSRVVKHQPPFFTSLEHIGVVSDGVDDTTSAQARVWTPAVENYTLAEKDGGTEFAVEMAIPADYKTYFVNAWRQALKNLKALAEAA